MVDQPQAQAGADRHQLRLEQAAVRASPRNSRWNPSGPAATVRSRREPTVASHRPAAIPRQACSAGAACSGPGDRTHAARRPRCPDCGRSGGSFRHRPSCGPRLPAQGQGAVAARRDGVAAGRLARGSRSPLKSSAEVRSPATARRQALIRFHDAMAGFQETDHRGVVEHLRVDPAAPAPGRHHQHGHARPHAEGAAVQGGGSAGVPALGPVRASWYSPSSSTVDRPPDCVVARGRAGGGTWS